MRVARDLRRNGRRFVTLESGAAAAQGAARDPEVSLLRRQYGARFNGAFARAMEGLSAKERTLLKLHVVDGMSLAKLGRIYHVHESTLSRRLADIRERVLVGVRDALEISPSEVRSVMALLRSELDLHLTTQLGAR
jgi:RNA polymerase sigma-70 factor (ECF subfamily)